MRYINAVVDNNTNATDALYTYACEDENVRRGARVLVTFGIHNRKTEGFAAEVMDEPPQDVPLAKIKKAETAPKETWLTEEMMDTALWMHRRCLCRYIEAVRCFLPTQEKRSGRSKDPFADIEISPDAAKELTGEQEKALSEISSSLESRLHEIFLLFGVTGSGKTEVYLQAMEKVLSMGRQGIVLVPEISLTPQTVKRFMDRFGREAVAVLHSRLTKAQRDAEYGRIKSGSARLVIGARSAVFAPFDDIGLIVLDEEHETSYKSDQSPKYDAIEVAVRRAASHGAAVVLGSATPSVADWYRAGQGLFRVLELDKRYNETPLPKVEIVDMTRETRAGNRSPFSRKLADDIAGCLARKEQVILFLNRRGYSSYVSCRECGHVIACPECGISMTYHKDRGACVCHYCGRTVRLPEKCPECGSPMIGLYGVGTQQVQEKAQELFPGAVIERVDLDSVNKKGSLEALLKRFGSGKTDILIGTQLVAKGLDFSNVGLVGVICADVSLNIPDYRSAERSFQLLTQAAGRAGRGGRQGRVIIQTYSPESRAVAAAARQDYRGFYESEIRVRRSVGYPPFSYIFQVMISDEDEEKAQRSAERCAVWLRKKLGAGVPVLGPAAPGLQKLSGQHRRQILIKAPAGARRQIAEAVLQLKKVYAKEPAMARVISVDINPYSFM
ncbi:MAG: primosomal protein N' [Firmicutes bacterium]|nr:primosomal protein N' [Bacillota bacterium]